MMRLKRSDCAVLHLVLKGRWYDMIERGEKREEYRDATEYWNKRFERWWNRPEPFRVVAFSRGRRKPTMFFFAGQSFCTHKGASRPEWGEPESEHHTIRLVRRVELVDGGEE